MKIEKVKRPAVTGNWTQDTSGLSRQCLPLSYNKTTTSPHNPLAICNTQMGLKCLSHTPSSHAVCAVMQNLVRDWPENSLHQERTHDEWFLSLELLPCVEIKGILMLWDENREKLKRCQSPRIEPRTTGLCSLLKSHLCSTYRGLWGLVVVRLS